MEFNLDGCCLAWLDHTVDPAPRGPCAGPLVCDGKSVEPVFFLTIFIGNLSWDAEREDLIHLFGQYGEVSKCSLPLDRETGRKRGFAFVDLSNEADEQSAIDDLQNVEWMGRAISVRKAEPRR